MAAPARYYPAKLILRNPPLYIGSFGDATNMEWLRSKNIGLIINVTPEQDVPAPFRRIIRTVRYPLWDSAGEATLMLEYLPKAALEIEAARNRGGREGKGVLVHCHAGISRSSTIVAGYLMTFCGLSAAEAVQRIKAKKPETFGGSRCELGVFSKALRAYERQLRQ